MTDEKPVVDMNFVRGAALGIVLGLLLWVGIIFALIRIFNR